MPWKAKGNDWIGKWANYNDTGEEAGKRQSDVAERRRKFGRKETDVRHLGYQ